MEDLSLREILAATSFRFNKGLGQNFISDKNLLDAIVADSGVGEDDVAVEIGTGAGTLTRALAKKAKKVYSFEVDKSLEPVLALSLRGVDNAEVIFRDVLKTSDEQLTSIVGDRFKVVANLPYYITTPLVMRFIESDLDVKSLTVMVQKEVADRFIAKAGSADYSAVTLALEMAGEATLTRTVSRKMFYPIPNVDSAVVRLDVDRNKLSGENKALIHRLVRGAFAMRRKTLVNNLSQTFGISKQDAADMILRAGFDAKIRGEALSLENYVALAREFEKSGIK